MIEMGLPCDKHHHEVAAAQHELGLTFGTLTETADRMQIYKYVVHQVAHIYGKTATFMPKPIKDDNGSGMHTHMSIWDGGKPTFAGNQYGGLSENCLYYIGGVIKHAKALNAFTNPDHQQLQAPGTGASKPPCCSPIRRATARHRAASPMAPGDKAKRRRGSASPDAMANPYLAYSALLMAGLDGITNKIHPGEAMDKEPLRSAARRTGRCGRPSAAACAKHWNRSRPTHEFLLKGDVFTKDQIEAYCELKWDEVLRVETTPCAAEFDMYYSA